MRALTRPLLLGTGWLCVGLGIVGIILPVFPTTPFLLVALWAFSKSSPELAERIRNHRMAGPYIRDWEAEGVIPVKAKVLAVAMMAAMLGWLFYAKAAPVWALAAAAVVMGAVAIYIVTRPSRRSGLPPG